MGRGRINTLPVQRCNLQLLQDESPVWQLCVQTCVLQVTPYLDDEVVLVCCKEHLLSKRESVTKRELKEFKFVSLFQSSTVQAIRSTLADHNIEWKALQVVLVSLL